MSRTTRAVRATLAVALLTVSIGLVAPSATTAATPGVYIALGDSIAAGIGASLPRTRGNTALVADWLARASGENVPYENLAVPGETAASFIEAGQLERFRTTVAQTRAAGLPIAAVTVSLGGNELLGLQSNGLSDRQAALDEFNQQYTSAIGAIRSEVGQEAPLVVTTSYDLSEGDPTIQFSDSWWIEQFNGVILRVAADQGARVAELTPAFDGRIGELTHYPFDVHPTNDGQLVIAQAVWKELDIDREAPTISVPPEIEATRSTPTLRFSVADNVGVRTVSARSDDVHLQGPFEVDTDVWVILIDLTTTDRPTVALSIEISDDTGNTIHQEITVQVANADRGESE